MSDAAGSPEGQPTAEGLHKLQEQRRQNREGLRALGFEPYGSAERGLTPLREAKARYDEAADKDHQANAKTPGFQDKRPEATVAGRVMLLRDNGKLIWATLRDAQGDLQVAISARDVSEADFKAAKLFDLADIIVVSGRLMKTKTGEVTVWASACRPAAKSLTPPPAKHDGLSDIELRYRQRYVDLWANPETLRVFELRSQIVSRVRRFMEQRGYLEVETPMLQTLAGGAAARPFVTHMNALDISLFMRIAPELYLKRLMVGGMARVFEINRNFRNEGLDKQHNPEFTMLEAYHAFGDVETVMELTESMIRDVARTIARERDQNELRRPLFDSGTYEGLSIGYVADTFPGYITHTLGFSPDKWDLPDNVRQVFEYLYHLQTRGGDIRAALRKLVDPNARAVLPWEDSSHTFSYIDYESPFLRRSYEELFAKAYGFEMSDTARARALLKERIPKHASAVDGMDPWLVVNELFEDKQHGGEAQLDHSRPTFITDYPSAISPLTRPKRSNPALADRADLFIAGMEIAPHYTELNDPDIQEAKFKEQLTGLDADKNAEENTFRTMDHDFLRALKVGMPPAGGMGLGIDRLVMLLTNQRTIRDVVLFPLMRPE